MSGEPQIEGFLAARILRYSGELKQIEVDQDGFIEVPKRPGLGFELNEEVIEKSRVEPH